MDKIILRSLIETYQDFQKLRIAIGNRLVANFLYKLGKMPNKPLDDEKSEAVIKFIKNEYKRLTDAVAKIVDSRKRLKIFKKEGVLINESYEYEIVGLYFNFLDAENRIIKEIKEALKYFPIWSDYLVNVEGIGPAIAGYIISYLDPYKANHPSSFWKYCGLHVVDGKAPRKEKGKPVDYNVKLRSKIIGVLGDQFVKRPQTKYGKVYREYKQRIESKPKWKETTALHRHRAAVRYAVKMFLKDLWLTWRAIEGLPISKEYQHDG